MPRSLLPALLFATTLPLAAADYDLVIEGGRVMDPETGLDAVRNVGVRAGRIEKISRRRLTGARGIDATGLVVAPGFIDLHSHGQDERSNGFQAADGVTTALELEIGVLPVGTWLADRAGKAIIHYGATAGHLAGRMNVVSGTEIGNPVTR